MPRSASPPPMKRARLTQSPATSTSTNGHMRDSQPLPPLSLSILGVEPLDEFIKEIADFVHHMIVNRPDVAGTVEVEAKIGVLRDKASGQRINLPVLVESIIAPDSIDCRFESNMSVNQHKHYNSLLNNLMTNSQPASSSQLKYSHLHLFDSFYPAAEGPAQDKIRVTRDEQTKTVTACVRKIRLGDLNVYSPKRAADWRSQTLYELELEIARPEILLATAATRGDVNLPEHERSAFDELIRAFVNNARILVRNSSDGWQ
ncbi:hypothetical protein C0989_000130 [Termitomyces sp. Mn162]|nr:hypothetical protein C0989_000130 [Termitomyces sp. Mn162]